MCVSTATFTLPPNLAPFSAPLKTFHQSYDSATRLVVGAFIFSKYPSSAAPFQEGAEGETTREEPRMLLLHRASSNAYGDLWDFPGGSVENTDMTMIDAVKREVMEETGLKVSETLVYVGMHTWVETQPQGDIKWAKFSFIVQLVEGSETNDFEIKLAEAEHQAFVWATEDVIKASLEDREDALKFIAIEEIEVAAEAFRRRKFSVKTM